MSVKDNSSFSKAPAFKYVAISLLSAVSVYSFGTLYSYTYPGGYYGDGIFSFNPISILLFIVCFLLLNRFLKKEILSDIGRVVISCICGFLLSVAGMYSTLMLYGNNTIFSAPVPAGLRILSTFGMALFFVPAVSELVGLTNLLFAKRQAAAPATSVLFYEKNNIIYFLVVWGLLFLSFIPLFLYSYPINFIYDAGDQVRDYMMNTLSTHHTILHSVLLGFFYNLGYQKNDPSSGLVFYTLIQMLVLSASFAFFLKYVKEKEASRGLRIVLFLAFLLNPLNAYYSISTIKGVLGGAFLIFAITFLMKIFDGKKLILNSVLFVAASVLSCLFRNNMIYALAVAGIIIALLRGGLKKGLHILLLTAIICVGYLGCNKLLMTVFNAPDPDSARESMSVPLMCLARVCINHKEELDPDIYNEILTYIDEDSISQYSFVMADDVKGNANEQLLRNNKLNFFKLFAKVGLKYPGEYIEAICGLTLGYYAPLNSPYFVTGTTKLYVTEIGYGYPGPTITDKLPFGSKIFDWLYGEKDGRLSVPLFGMLWRGAIYFWGFIYAFLYLLYKKSKGNLCILLIPLLYMLTCLLGPTSFLRYICINIFSLPIAIYLILSDDISKKVSD